MLSVVRHVHRIPFNNVETTEVILNFVVSRALRSGMKGERGRRGKTRMYGQSLAAAVLLRMFYQTLE